MNKSLCNLAFAAGTLFPWTCAFAQMSAPRSGSVIDLAALPARTAPAPAALKDAPSCPPGSGGEINFQMSSSGAKIETGLSHPALKLEIMNLSNTKLADGDDVTADVHITNTSTKEFKIPWSGDRSVVPFAAGAKVKWVQAEIDLTIRSPRSIQTLESPANTLYGVGSRPATWKTLAPGESATVRLGFKIHPAKAASISSVARGSWELSATWNQAQRTLFSTDCKYESGWWFDTVKNESGPVPIEVVAGPPTVMMVGPVAAEPLMMSMHVTLSTGTDGVEFDSTISAALRNLQGAAQVSLSDANAKPTGDLELRFTLMKDGSPAPDSVRVMNSTVSRDARDAIVKGIEQLRNIAPLPAEFDRKSIDMRVTYTFGSVGGMTLHNTVK